jgi:hypothetical protein
MSLLAADVEAMPYFQAQIVYKHLGAAMFFKKQCLKNVYASYLYYLLAIRSPDNVSVVPLQPKVAYESNGVTAKDLCKSGVTFQLHYNHRLSDFFRHIFLRFEIIQKKGPYII